MNALSPERNLPSVSMIGSDLRDALSFYLSLGVERIPVTLPGKIRGGLRIKEAALDALRNEIGDCRRCGLSKGRTNIVFGEGNPDARLMFIGEAPGREEDLQARPFIGEAGMLLTRLIERMGFSRDDVYIGNIVKCRPPQNRDPEPEEMAACRGFIERQIEIIGPEVIMSLGRISSLTLVGDPKLKISAIRGRFFEYRGIPLMPTFHPAYLMRNPRDKWLTWNDALQVLELLGKEVSAVGSPVGLRDGK